MQYGKRIYPDSFTSTVVDVLPSVFNNTEAVVQGDQRLYESDYLYEARTNIYPLATYSWNHIEASTNGICTILATKALVPDTTVVPVTKDVTVVYVIDTYKDTTNIVDGKYFMYKGNNSTENFNTIDVTHPSWEEVANHRYIDATPSESSIYWKYLGVKNSKAHLDGIVNNQTILESGTQIDNVYIFTDRFIDTIAFFNLDCTSVEITVTKLDDTVIVPTFTLDLKDYQGITTPYNWHFTPIESVRLKNKLARISVNSNIKILISYIKSSGSPKIGEVFFTRSKDMGQTLNRPQGRKKKFDRVIIDKTTGAKTRIKSKALVDEVSYSVIVGTNEIDSKITIWTDLINEDILIIGDESGKYTNLIHFAYIQEFPYEIDTASSHNIYQIKLTTLA